MATSKNAKMQFEFGQTAHTYAAMTDSGDHKVHTVTGGTVFSGKSGYEPIVRPNGVVSGRNMVTPNSLENTVSIAGFTAYSGGTLYTVASSTLVLTRASTDVAQVHSITMTSAGALVIVEGEDSADSSLSTVRGAAGGPPSIPADSVEIAQVRLTGNASAVISADEIFQTVGGECERYDYPTWKVNNIGDGVKASSAAKENAYVEFSSTLPCIHGSTAEDPADAYKKVYIRYYEPGMIDLSHSVDFVPVENAHTTSSEQVYENESIGSFSSSIGQGGFVALLNDGVTDAIKSVQDEVITFKHWPDKNKSAYSLTQGVLGIKTTYPVNNQNRATCTISAERITANFTS